MTCFKTSSGFKVEQRQYTSGRQNLGAESLQRSKTGLPLPPVGGGDGLGGELQGAELHGWTLQQAFQLCSSFQAFLHIKARFHGLEKAWDSSKCTTEATVLARQKGGR